MNCSPEIARKLPKAEAPRQQQPGIVLDTQPQPAARKAAAVKGIFIEVVLTSSQGAAESAAVDAFSLLQL